MVCFVSAVDNIDVPSAKCLLRAVTESLLKKYGSTMGFKDIGAEIGTSAGAVRLRQFRIGDLPNPIPYLRESRWPTPEIAMWLCGITGASGAEQPSPHQARHSSGKRGRRRKLASTTTVEGHI